MNDRDYAVVARFKELTANMNIERLIVFGSRARGEDDHDSDLDLAVIVSKRNDDVDNKLYNAAYAVMMEFDFSPIISLKVFDSHSFEKHLKEGFSFYRHLVEEGIIN